MIDCETRVQTEINKSVESKLIVRKLTDTLEAQMARQIRKKDEITVNGLKSRHLQIFPEKSLPLCVEHLRSHSFRMRATWCRGADDSAVLLGVTCTFSAPGKLDEAALHLGQSLETALQQWNIPQARFVRCKAGVFVSCFVSCILLRNFVATGILLIVLVMTSKRKLAAVNLFSIVDAFLQHYDLLGHTTEVVICTFDVACAETKRRQTECRKKGSQRAKCLVLADWVSSKNLIFNFIVFGFGKKAFLWLKHHIRPCTFLRCRT